MLKRALTVAAMVAGCAPAVDPPPEPTTNLVAAPKEPETKVARALEHIDTYGDPILVEYGLCLDQEVDGLWQTGEPADTVAIAALGNCTSISNAMAEVWREGYRLAFGAPLAETLTADALQMLDEAATTRAITRVTNRRAGR